MLHYRSTASYMLVNYSIGPTTYSLALLPVFLTSLLPLDSVLGRSILLINKIFCRSRGIFYFTASPVGTS